MDFCPFHCEAQTRAHCTLHTANHLLGGRCYTAARFDTLAEEMARESRAHWVGADPLHDQLGNYDLQVLEGALLRKGKKGREGTAFLLANRSADKDTLIVDIQKGAVRALVVHCSYLTRGGDLGHHFYCLRFHVPSGRWWNLDSVLQPPAMGPTSIVAHGVVSRLRLEMRTHSPPKGDIIMYSVPFLETSAVEQNEVHRPSPCPGPALALGDEGCHQRGPTVDSHVDSGTANGAALDPGTC